jgi:putative N6-adenine-specific DNA methylase
MDNYNIVITSAFGIESIVADELRSLGYDDISIENGRLSFTGTARDIVTCNMWLRTADRVLLKIAEFPAHDFDQLFDGTKAIDWPDIIPVNGKMHVIGKSVKSKLHGVPACQGMVKKAIVESMQKRYKIAQFPEDGPIYKIEISILNDIATLSIDTSGIALHRRGYRQDGGIAPLKETLAAAIVKLSRWETSRKLADPFCGSGTIAIEAAMMARNIAPGLKRRFASEKWPQFRKTMWEEERNNAESQINNDIKFRILASDIDTNIIEVAKKNAQKAGVGAQILFQQRDVKEFRAEEKYGCIITNPPYGERLNENSKEVDDIYIKMGKALAALDNWSFFILTAHPDFTKLFGSRENKNRKLYNGNILCYLYQYFGELPR